MSSQAMGEIEILEEHIRKIYQTQEALRLHGLNQTSFSLLGAVGLLSGSSLESIAIESLNDESFAVAQTAALEALDKSANEKAVSWSAKILTFVKDGTQTILDRISSIWSTIKEKAAALTQSGWDMTKATGAEVKAHPYKTIALVLGAAAMAFGIASFVGRGFPIGNVTLSQMTSFTSKLDAMYRKVTWPFGKVITTLSPDGTVVKAVIENVVNKIGSASVTTLGWTSAGVSAITKNVERIVDGTTSSLKSVWDHILKPAGQVVDRVMFAPKDIKDAVVAKTGVRTLGLVTEKLTGAAYYSILFKISSNLYQFIKDVTEKALQMVKDTFTSLTKVFA